MALTTAVRDILKNYESDSPGTISSLARLLCHGKLAGTGRMVIYPVDQGFEHGPGRSFAINPDAYDPHYHFKVAIEAGLSALAAPLGILEAGARTFAAQVPMILKMNSANSLSRHGQNALEADQAITASIDDALRLGCTGIGFTIYPGTDTTYNLFEEIREISEDAKRCGLAVIIWSYPRGNMSREGETALDVVGYAAHMACLLGAHIIKIKLPTEHIEFREAKIEYDAAAINLSSLEARIRHIRECGFAQRRMMIFSGGASRPIDEVYQEVRAIHNAGGNGSIIGRNVFRRPYKEALEMLEKIVNIYLGK